MSHWTDACCGAPLPKLAALWVAEIFSHCVYKKNIRRHALTCVSPGWGMGRGGRTAFLEVRSAAVNCRRSKYV